MSVVFLLIGLVIGAACAALVFRSRLAAASRELEVAALELELERERLSGSQRSQQEQAQTFKALSQEALQANMQQLMQIAKGQLGGAQELAKGELEKRQQAVEALVKPLKEQLETLNKERRESQVQLHTQIRALTEAQDKLRTETGALVTALRRPNTRGQWGQMQLRKVVELAGMVEHCDFTEQASFGGPEDGVLRPDMVVNLPGGKQVPVDAKTPLQSILDAHEAQDEETRARFMRDHARLLRRHVKQLADKAYWSGMESAPDFVVLFLPGEHLYSEALSADPELIEDAMARRVLIATPTTLLALLHSVGYGWQQERVAESAMKVSELGRELYGRLARLSGLLGTVGTRLNSTVRAYNEAVASYEARVLPGARKFAEHGAVSGGSEIPDLEQITVSARDVRLSDEDEDEAERLASAEDEVARLPFGL